eukprot:CAMPEP_0168382644 /NCGR_PEP_ID=MMETSP0228-20121227/13500_1 /TAXON_ID=133427 /ORGANISM="Protoceratium reticulatum, Strain CCCM 535 (=CCMP 1889)" /LENGTH=329 /DNA_ID=CAMNT_0008395783 /DNA_START=1 /DNA_END=991 /DNA_ORIENTATION=+
MAAAAALRLQFIVRGPRAALPRALPRAAGRPAAGRAPPGPLASARAVPGSTFTRRAYSTSGGQDDDGLPGQFPDSWVEPEALWEYAQAHKKGGGDVDDEFAEAFGRRNQAWREKKLQEDPDIFSRIGQGQAPKYLWIGCCDSRVAAENLVGGQPGEIFVHRNIANMVIATDSNLRAVLHYAVDYLQVQHLIVCGHYDCGGVKAAMANRDHTSPVESWLTHIRDVYRMHSEELDAIIDDEERHKRLVELNVIEQCLNLFKTNDVQRRRCYTAQRPDIFDCAYPRIHAMVFAPHDGILRRLPIDFKHYMRKMKRVYQMYDTNDFIASHETP